MHFFNRLLFFFCGIFLGVGILLLSLKHREAPISFNYFPNSRVKSFLMKNDILISQQALCEMKCFQLDTTLLDQYISNAKVDFQKSQIRGYNPKLYHLKQTTPSSFCFQFAINQDSVKLISVSSQNNELNTCLNCY